MKKLFAFLCCLWVAVPCVQAQIRLSDAIAVIVHTNVITARDIDSRIMHAVEMLYQQYPNQPEEMNKRAMALRREAIENLVEQELILQDFKASKLVLPDNYVAREIERKIREGYGDRLTLVKTLQAQGLTFEGFRKRTRDEVILQAMYGKYVSSVNIVSPKMILDYYEAHQNDFKVDDQVRIRTIMLMKAGKDEKEVRAVADEIYSQISEGADFKEMVSVYSEDQLMKGQEDAHLQWRELTGLQDELREKIKELKPGETSGVIETRTALWIVRLEDFKAAHVQDIEEVREQIEGLIKDEAQAKLKKVWIDRLKKKYLVRYY